MLATRLTKTVHPKTFRFPPFNFMEYGGSLSAYFTLNALAVHAREFN